MMEYLIVKDGIIDNIIMCDNIKFATSIGAVPSYNGAMIGTQYYPPGPTPSELREAAYNNDKIISWAGEMITVTEASQQWQYYAAEGSEKAAELQTLISEAKASIRENYPDE